MSQRMRPPASSAALLPLSERAAGDHRLLTAAETGLKPRRPRRRRPWRRYLLVAVALYCAWLGRGEWVTYHHLTGKLAMLDAAAAIARDQQSQLQAEIGYAQTPGYVEAAARQDFGMVQQGEVPLVPVTSGTTSTTGS